MPANRAVPVRTCVGCRVRAGKPDLLRVVAVAGALVPDPPGRMPGRGAHLHPDPRCLALAERRRAFVRALRLPTLPDLAAVRGYVAAQVAATEPEPRVVADDERSMSTSR